MKARPTLGSGKWTLWDLNPGRAPWCSDCSSLYERIIRHPGRQRCPLIQAGLARRQRFVDAARLRKQTKSESQLQDMSPSSPLPDTSISSSGSPQSSIGHGVTAAIPDRRVQSRDSSVSLPSPTNSNGASSSSLTSSSSPSALPMGISSASRVSRRADSCISSSSSSSSSSASGSSSSSSSSSSSESGSDGEAGGPPANANYCVWLGEISPDDRPAYIAVYVMKITSKSDGKLQAFALHNSHGDNDCTSRGAIEYVTFFLHVPGCSDSFVSGASSLRPIVASSRSLTRKRFQSTSTGSP